MTCKNKIEEDGFCKFTMGKELCSLDGEYLCRETLSDNLPLLSHSAREMWIKCKRAYYLYRVRGISAKKDKITPALKFGTMWDKFMENKYEKENDLSKLAISLKLTDLEVSKFNAITSAFNQLNLSAPCGNYELQKRILIKNDVMNVIGYVDRAYPNYFVETKMSARPQHYQEPFNIAFQVGTYFIANPNWKYVVMEVTRTPTMTWDSNNETLEQYEDRLYNEIIKKAPVFFPGIKRKDHTFGKKFFREEFPLDDIQKTYDRIGREILEASKHNDDSYFYQSFNCSTPFPCEYLSICKDGVISETLYNMRKKEEHE